MITVAQRTAVPLIPTPRGRFTALVLGPDPERLSRLVPRLRTGGATAVHTAATARDGQLPRPLSTGDVAVVDGTTPGLADELFSLRAQGWRRLVVVAEHTDDMRAALRGGARSALLPPRTGPTATLPLPGRVPRAPHGGDGLSEREIQVLQLAADGNTNKQIGVALGLSALTVKSHLARIARKLGTGDRAEMVAHGMRSGILS